MKSLKRGMGFTLIELLVVVSIIALLVSMLLPALGKARDQAKSVVCQARLSQLNLMMQYYFDHSNGIYPPSLSTEGKGAGLRYVTWIERIVTVGKIENPAFFRCPSDRNSAWTKFDSLFNYYAASSYGLNFAFLSFGREDMGWNSNLYASGMPKIRISHVKDPYQTIMVADSGRDDGVLSSTYVVSPLVGGNLPVANRHRGKVNVLWCDGHVAPITRDRIVDHYDGEQNWYYWNNKTIYRSLP